MKFLRYIELNPVVGCSRSVSYIPKWCVFLVVIAALGCSSEAAPCDGHVGRTPLLPEKVLGDVMATRLVDKLLPEYPDSAQQTRLEGTAVIRLTVDPEGCPALVTTVSGPVILVDAVKSVVFRWRYTPTVVNGEARWVDTTVSVLFSLDENLAPNANMSTARRVIHLKNGRTISADSAREVGDKVEYMQGEGTYGVPKDLVQDISPITASVRIPTGMLVVTPRSASRFPSAVGNWPPWESTRNIQESCVDDGYNPSKQSAVLLGAQSCAIWRIDMGSEYEALVDRGIALRREICANGKVTFGSVRDEMHLLDELGRIRAELLRRQSQSRFDEAKSTRIVTDYNRMSIACPK